MTVNTAKILRSPMYTDYYRLLVLNEDESCALMIEEDGVWDLPYFELKPATPTNLKSAVDGLQELLGLDPEDQFLTPIAPVQRHSANRGRRCAHLKWQQHMLGNVYLVLLDCHIDMATVKMPENFKWQDSEFLKGISIPEKYDDDSFEVILRRTAQVLDKEEWITKMLWQPQHQAGWFGKASNGWRSACARTAGKW